MDEKKLALRNKIKRGLLKQLKTAGVKDAHYIDMVEKYMSMWDMAQALEEDFLDNGVKILSSTGSKMNPSIPEYAKTNNQMLKLLSELGIKPVAEKAGGDDDY